MIEVIVGTAVLILAWSVVADIVFSIAFGDCSSHYRGKK